MEKIENKAIEILKKGGVVIFPTDTVYGIGALPKKKSVEKIYKIKHRDFSKKIIALVSDVEKIQEMIDETPQNLKKIQKIINKFWPGELTIIFNANKNFTKKFDENLDTIGIRIPKNKIALELIRNAGGIILTTSANLSGEPATTDLKKINVEVLENVDFVIEEKGMKLTGMPSTIIKFDDGKIELLRKGNVSLKEIRKEI